jgi:hypothetical protein
MRWRVMYVVESEGEEVAGASGRRAGRRGRHTGGRTEFPPCWLYVGISIWPTQSNGGS